MTSDELKAIEQRAEAATPGPWVSTVDAEEIVAPGVPETRAGWPKGPTPVIEAGGWEADGLVISDEDLAFVCAARTDVPALVAEVRRLQLENEELHHLTISLGMKMLLP